MKISARDFALGVVATLFIIGTYLYWSSARYSLGSAPLYVRVPGSASGLQSGSSVTFNGIPIGHVQHIWLDGDDPRWVVIVCEIDNGTPINESTEADILFTATGYPYIELHNTRVGLPNFLDLNSDRPAVLVANPPAVTNVPPSPAIESWLLQRTSTQLTAMAAGCLLLLWSAILTFIYWTRPGLLVSLHETMPEPEKIDLTASAFDKVTFGGAKLVCWLLSASLMFLALRPRALDAWVHAHLNEARRLFEQRQSVRDRRVTLDLPVKISGARWSRPWPEITRLLSEPSPSAILISGPGGAGKTTLAFEIARRGLDPKSSEGVSRHPMIPLVLEADLPDDVAKPDSLVSYVAGILRTAVNEKRRVSTRMTSALLKSGRVLMVVDGISERSQVTREAFNPQRHGFEALRLIVTGREKALPGMNISLEAESIPSGALFDFMLGYLRELESGGAGEALEEDVIFEVCAQLKRLLGETACTPLLAVLWAKEIAAPVGSTRPRGVAGLMDSYVRRLLLPAVNGDEALVHQLTRDACKIAELELGELYQPRYVTRSAALDTLIELSDKYPERRFALLENSRILESPPESDVVRISPDPVAEHLVARLVAEEFGNHQERWVNLLETVKKLRAEGFLNALAACVDDDVHGREVPTLVRNQLTKLRLAPDSLPE